MIFCIFMLHAATLQTCPRVFNFALIRCTKIITHLPRNTWISSFPTCVSLSPVLSYGSGGNSQRSGGDRGTYALFQVSRGAGRVLYVLFVTFRKSFPLSISTRAFILNGVAFRQMLFCMD